MGRLHANRALRDEVKEYIKRGDIYTDYVSDLAMAAATLSKVTLNSNMVDTTKALP